jgi:thiol-disulfide isomerase/thioredoxin
MTGRRAALRGVLLCAMLLLTLSAVAHNQALSSKSRATKTKEPAPRFNATTTSGEKFSNVSIKGKVVLLEFWTTWCSFCAEEVPYVEKINREFSGKDLVILAVNVGESKKTVKKYLDLHPRTCKVVLTDDTNLAAMYAATVYPIYVAIDRDGNIAGTQRGAGGEESLRELLASAGLDIKTESDTDSASATP